MKVHPLLCVVCVLLLLFTPVAARSQNDAVSWTGEWVRFDGRVSADGKLMTWADPGGRLMLHNLATNEDREITPTTANARVEWSAISLDRAQVAYVWVENGRYDFRVASLETKGPPPRVLATGSFFSPFDWSPDGKWIAAVRQANPAELGLFDVTRGTFQPVKAFNGNTYATARGERTALRLSPDGKFIAYDRRAAVTGSLQRDIFVISVDGRTEIEAVVHGANDKVMEWSRDGRSLFFSSDRTGTVALWRQTFANGKVSGQPELIDATMGESYPIGITDSGKLFVHREVTTRDVALARIDLAVGRLLEAPKRFTIGFLENTRNPTWSPDGKYLAYAVKCNNGCLAIRTVATGEVRRLAPTLNDARAPRWSPDGRQLVVRGTHVNGQSGIFVVDVQTEETKAVAVGPGLNPDVGWSKDGKKIHFNRQGVLVEFDVATGSERDFFDLFQATGVRSADISPDGRHFAILGLEETPRSARLLLLPTEGGALREIFRFPQTDSVYGHVEWIPDSGAVLVQRYVNARWELWRIPVTAGVPTKLEIDPTLWRAGVTGEGTTVFRGDAGFSLSPDGRTVAIMIGTSDGEIRLLDVSVRP